MWDRLVLLFVFSSIACLAGCSEGFAGRTETMRAALDAGRPRGALDALNAELGVKSDAELPRRVAGDDALLVLDRATVQQSVAQFEDSERDFSAADKAIDVLDLSHDASDSVARWAFSDSAGRYVAPPHEKLLVNTLDMINYLEKGDLSGARVEARRFSVMERYLDERRASDPPLVALGAILAGYTFEASGRRDEAASYYRDAQRVRDFGPLSCSRADDAPVDDGAELLVVIGYGRVPHRIAERVPVGLALTRASGALSAGDRARADELAAQGLVSWIVYPALAPDAPITDRPTFVLDGHPMPLEDVVDVAGEVRAQYQKLEGAVVAAAVSRMIVRVAAGKGVEAIGEASGGKNGKVIGQLLSLLLQAGMTAADTPDTRSWETLPARVALARVRVPRGDHTVTLSARGQDRPWTLHAEPGGYAVVSLMALR